MTQFPDSRRDTGIGPLNWVLFFAISLAVLVGWQLLFPPPPPPDPTTASVPAPADPAPSASLDAGSTEVPQPAASAGRLEADAVARQVVEAGTARVEVTSRGGRVTSWQLRNHPSYRDGDGVVELVKRPRVNAASDDDATGSASGEDGGGVGGTPAVADDAPLLPLQVVTGDAALDRTLAEALHVVTVERDDDRRVVSMRWSNGQGTSVDKRLVLTETSPLALVEARLSVDGRPRAFHLAWGPGIGDHGDTGGMYFQRGRVTWRGEGDLDDGKKPSDFDELPARLVQWAAVEDSYFTAAFIPIDTVANVRSFPRADFRVGGELPVGPDGKRASGSEWPDHVSLEVPFSPERPAHALYVGPRDHDVLQEVSARLGPALHLESLTYRGAVIGPIARFMHFLLVWFYQHVGSWGVSIFLLTLAIRGALFPLMHYSLKKTRVMQEKMKAVKPQLDALKNKYAKMDRTVDVRRREQEEMMALYRSAGINPGDQVLGCLPTLLSLPFFFALFRLLQGASEFRQQGFLWWSDLASPDPSYVMPVAIGATTYLTQKLAMPRSKSSGSPDQMEQMQKNMLTIMPIMFVAFCWKAPLGLLVYWMTSNVISIGQQYLLKFTLPAPEDPSSQGSEKKARSSRKGGTSRKSDAGASDATGQSSNRPRRKRRKR